MAVVIISRHRCLRDVNQRLKERLHLPGESPHPNLRGKLRYYTGTLHAAMHNIEPTIWNFWKSTGNQTLLTAAFIATHLKKNARLSELRVCSCDPAKCVFSNGVKGPLLNKDDIYRFTRGGGSRLPVCATEARCEGVAGAFALFAAVQCPLRTSASTCTNIIII